MRTANRPPEDGRETALAQAPKGKMPMLQEIRKRFTSGRHRKYDLGVTGPMPAVLLAKVEADNIRDFVRERGGNPQDFVVQVAVVAGRKGGLDFDRGKTYLVPDELDPAIELADKLKKIDEEAGLLFAGLLVAVLDRKTGAVCRWMRPFVVSPEASEILARAALAQRFQGTQLKGGKI